MTDAAAIKTGVVVLAAGKGTRLRSDVPKALHAAAGRTLLGWTLENIAPLGVAATVAVVGDGAAAVTAALPGDVAHVIQDPQLGTGDAARIGAESLPPDVETVLIVPVDMPLLSSDTLGSVVDTHHRSENAATLLVAAMNDPTGYGRVLRDGETVVGIIEEGDASDEQRAIDEVNTSVYAFDRALLTTALSALENGNAQGEYYLTDVIEQFAAAGNPVGVVRTDEVEALGVNTHGQLAAAGGHLRRRINERLMDDGVAMIDPDRVYIDAGVTVAGGARLYPDVYLHGETSVGAGAEVGPSVHATDTSIGESATIRFAVIDRTVIGKGAIVGPFTHLRPGTDLGEGAKAGEFVGIKNSTIGKGSKVPHLSYVGDADIGEGSNLGAGTVTVNYDGYEKHRTTIGDRVRIGSDTMLIAPVEIGDDAYTGAGSVITEDVAPGALAVERSSQVEVPGYAERRRRRAAQDRDS
ncbi:MAG: bifunctional UDP-N-acetylglucosamine diphosphorylase/glucosamine-1-phosphate N-acetyltransferase GlmU [Acidimicrobiia bacterium]|nr:MAG: bifunctional UDP-N-acetylglucosamine diphosphorylase/glucosamine-1-phosphate N-acetyltransferase GlmU [Acidimicrobiia bacterium]